MQHRWQILTPRVQLVQGDGCDASERWCLAVRATNGALLCSTRDATMDAAALVTWPEHEALRFVTGAAQVDVAIELCARESQRSWRGVLSCTCASAPGSMLHQRLALEPSSPGEGSWGGPVVLAFGLAHAAMEDDDDDDDDDDKEGDGGARDMQSNPASVVGVLSSTPLARLRTGLRSAGSTPSSSAPGDQALSSPSVAVGRLLESRQRSLDEAKDLRAEAFHALRTELATEQQARADLARELAALTAELHAARLATAHAQAEASGAREEKDRMQAAVMSVTKLCTDQSHELAEYESRLSRFEIEAHDLRAELEAARVQNSLLLQYRAAAEERERAAARAGELDAVPYDAASVAALREQLVELEAANEALTRQSAFQARRLLALTQDVAVAEAVPVHAESTVELALAEQVERLKRFRDKLIDDWEQERARVAGEHAQALADAATNTRALESTLGHVRVELSACRQALYEAQEGAQQRQDDAVSTVQTLSRELEAAKQHAGHLARKLANMETEAEALRSEREALAGATDDVDRRAVLAAQHERVQVRLTALEVTNEDLERVCAAMRVEAADLRMQLALKDKDLESARARLEMTAFTASAELEQLRVDLQQYEADRAAEAAERRAAQAELEIYKQHVVAVRKLVLAGGPAGGADDGRQLTLVAGSLPEEDHVAALRSLLELSVNESSVFREKLAMFEEALITTKIERAQTAFELELANQSIRKLMAKVRRLTGAPGIVD